ncbi:MAG TPA: GNAT family N-acetyltransferase [Mycobacteriales bacterium]|nr:GNAT family N-acetyltransferase [Mycobacteriales bacterium]
MTAEFYESWMARLTESYAQHHVEAGNWSADEAVARARAETVKLLPDGVNSANHLLLTAQNESGETVGLVWIGLVRPDQQGAWIYDIEVFEGFRGSGYGRALLAAAEDAARDAGARTLGLNVFGPNTTARALYESSGYDTTSLQMRKQL